MPVVNLVESITIRAPRERVFDLRADLRNLPQYNSDISDLRSVDAQTFAFRVRVAPGIRLTATLKVTLTDRPRRVDFHIDFLFPADEVGHFEETAEGTALRCEVHVQNPAILDSLVTFVARRQLQRELARMKEILEGP